MDVSIGHDSIGEGHSAICRLRCFSVQVAIVSDRTSQIEASDDREKIT
jgi:hypothetical protein